MTNMSQTLDEKSLHVFVVERIKHVSPIFTITNQPHLTHIAQLVRHSRLAHAQGCCQVVDTHFVLSQYGNDAQSAGVAQPLENARKAPRKRSRHDGSTRRQHARIVDLITGRYHFGDLILTASIHG